MPENQYYKRFLEAFRYLLDRDWTRRQKALAIDVGVSPGFISDVKNGKSIASDATQALFSEKMGYLNFDDFIDLGRSIIEARQTPINENASYSLTHEKVPYPINNSQSERTVPKVSEPSNVIHFNGHIESKADKMHKDLDMILQSGDDELIDAIRMNLVSFRKKVELQKQVEDQGKRIVALEAAIIK